MIQYLETGELPAEEKKAKEIILGKVRYTLIDGILYHIGMDKSLQIVLPKQDGYNIFKEVHQGKFAGHLQDAKIHGQLSKTYWWPHMRKDISSLCRACEMCASRYHDVGKPIKPFLTPIPVGGPFDRVGVDIIKFPKSNRGSSMQSCLLTT